MISMANVDLEEFLPIFVRLGAPVAFLSPTETGLEKSIMDAIESVRYFLKKNNIHNYDLQSQGPEFKVRVKSFLVHAESLEESEASLYRPQTKKGDPRIWFKKLKSYCSPHDLLALIAAEDTIYVVNLSNCIIANSLRSGGYVYNILKEKFERDASISEELLLKLKAINKLGYLPSITKGDPGVGDTLENALGISRNNSKSPDYKGIELKAKRAKALKKDLRSTLFTKTPTEGLSYREIVDKYGKLQTPKKSNVERLQLYETFSTLRVNAYGLRLVVDYALNKLKIHFVQENGQETFVSAWDLSSLQDILLEKHPETFWVIAEEKIEGDTEYFKYVRASHTRNPNASLLPQLLETGVITVDLAAHYKPNGKWRDHGILFKIHSKHLSLLFEDPIEYDLSE